MADLERERDGLQQAGYIAIDGEVAELVLASGQVGEQDHRSGRAVHADELRDTLPLFVRDGMTQDDEIEVAGEEIFNGVRCGVGAGDVVSGFFQHAVPREEEWTITPGGKDRVALHGALVETVDLVSEFSG